MNALQDRWKCPTCEFMNGEDQISCLMCNTPRGKVRKTGGGEGGSANSFVDQAADSMPPLKKQRACTVSASGAEPTSTVIAQVAAAATTITAKGSGKKEKKKEGDSTEKAKKKKAKPFNKAYKAELSRLEAFLLSPAAATDAKHAGCDSGAPIRLMSPTEIVGMLSKYVPNISQLYDRRRTCSVVVLIVQTYNNGLPLYNSIPAVKEHTKHAIQYIFDTLSDSRKGYSETEKRTYLSRLAEAFTSCQAGQARELDAVYGSLIGRSMDLRGQILSLVDEQKQRVLDMVTQKLHPDAWTSLDPTHQAPHIESAYTLLFGKQLGLRGTDGAGVDYCMASVSHKEAEMAEKEFRKLFSAEETLETIVQDVNQQSPDADRMISRDDLSKWAGDTSANGGFDPWSIFYDEDNADDYPEDTKPTDENMYQPFLSKKVALNLFMKLFGL